MSKEWKQREEPCLNEVMNDPIIGLVLARDNLTQTDVWKVIRQAQVTIKVKAKQVENAS